MKKILIVVLLAGVLIAGVFILTGCGNENQETEIKTNNKTITNEFLVGDTSLKFDIDKTFIDFNYKTAEGIRVDETKLESNLYYENKNIYDGEFVFIISTSVIKNYSFDDWKYGPKEGEYETIEINGIQWKAYTDTSNGYTVKNYVTDKNNSLYVFKFTKHNDANVNIDELADVFMNGVTTK